MSVPTNGNSLTYTIRASTDDVIELIGHPTRSTHIADGSRSVKTTG